MMKVPGGARHEGRMGYASLRQCVADLERHKRLVRIGVEVDAHLEAAAIHRRVYAAGGPAVLFERVKGCTFPMVSNLFGSLEQIRFLFRDSLRAVERLIQLRTDPSALLRRPFTFRGVPRASWHMLPKCVHRGPVLECQTTIRQLPQLVCWPGDGGAFVTLPLVYSEDVARPGWQKSNLGMYRVQLSGNEYEPDRQVGLHYQIHRGIGVHHAKAIDRGQPFRVNIFVGGPPALTVAAVMPLPEGVPELSFAGALGGRRVRLVDVPDLAGPRPPLAAEADFAIVGIVDPERLLPEGPFGDHLGYYSLAHPFPVLNVERVYHRRDAIWPFTVVGRPPQEDTAFGQFIHDLTGPAIPAVVPGVHAVHAVDAAGVHPLLLAVGSERYAPYAERRRPQELLTAANAVLGQGQLSLAKYLLIIAKEDAPDLDVHDIPAFFRHLLERIDWRTDLHFQTCTTIDTLDYSGTGLNEGSKVVFAAAGPKRRELATRLLSDFRRPDGFVEPRVALPGVLVLRSPAFTAEESLSRLCEFLPAETANFPLIVVADDSEFTARTLNNWLWVTFTRSNPAADIHGVGEFTHQKHWGCTGPLVIDARIKPHHAPALEEDPAMTKRVEALAAPAGPLHGLY
jgi:4-hydroxy-3-polyprenylbenzoate decarboxylase